LQYQITLYVPTTPPTAKVSSHHLFLLTTVLDTSAQFRFSKSVYLIMRRLSQPRHAVLPALPVGFWALCFTFLLGSTVAYPVILQIEEDSTRCLRLLIPEDDDAHVVFLTIPSADELDDEAVESWYVDQVYQLTKQKDTELAKRLPQEAPANVAQAMSAFLQEQGENKSPLRITLEDNGATGTRQFSYRTKFFLPTVLNHVRHSNYQKPKDKDEEEEWNDAAMEGYEICMINEDDEQAVQVIFESIYVSEDVIDVEDIKKPAFEKEKHLTPLEKNLDQSIQAAHAVLREMKYMEKRETRMRQTAESINSRVRWFSYLSIAVLFTVTYLQVTYLKRYFHKKKLM
jgi:hypothetical protein